jgi:hypothetical protein
MSSRDKILAGIARLRGRWWRVNLIRNAVQALFYLLLVGALVLLVFRQLDPGALALPLLGAAILAGAASSWLKRPSEAFLAKAFDDSAGLKDRVSSTVELMGQAGTSADPMVEALTEEAAAAADRVEPSTVYPFAMPREGWWLPVPALLVLAVVLLQGLTNADPKPDPAFEQSLEQRLNQLDELLSQEHNKSLTPRQRETLEELLQLKAELDNKENDRKDTMAEVAKVLENLQKARDKEQEKELELKKLLKGLQEKAGQKDLAEFMMKGDYQSALNKLQEKIDELREQLKKMKEEGASPEEIKQLEELLADLEEIEAKMMELLQLNLDLSMMGEAIDFLADWDGELGDLADLDPSMLVEPGEP